MNMHRLRIVDYDTPISKDGDSAIIEQDAVRGRGIQKDQNTGKNMLHTNILYENGGGDQNTTSDSTSFPAPRQRISLRKPRSKSELFRLPSHTKLRKQACKNIVSSEDLKEFCKNKRSNHRSRYNLVFNRDSILNLRAKGGDVQKSKRHYNKNEETSDMTESEKLNYNTRVKNHRWERNSIRKLPNDMFGFQKSNRQLDPCLYQTSCHFLDIDKHSAFNMFKKRFRRGKLPRKKQRQQCEYSNNLRCQQFRILNSEDDDDEEEDLLHPEDIVEKYYNLSNYKTLRKPQRTRKIYRDTWRRNYRNYHLRKDANVFVSSSALVPITRYCVDRGCGRSKYDITSVNQSCSQIRIPNRKCESVTSEHGFLNMQNCGVTPCPRPKTNTTRISMRNVCLGLLILVWSPCLLAVILAMIIIYPWKMSNYLSSQCTKTSCSHNSCLLNKLKPKCLVHECRRICSNYSRSQKKSVLSSVAGWFTRAADTAATSFHAVLSLVKPNKHRLPTCPASLFLPKVTSKLPNRKIRYDLYYAKDRGWVMKPMYKHSHTPKIRQASRLKKRSSDTCCISNDSNQMLLEEKPSVPNVEKVECSCTNDKPTMIYPCSSKIKQVNIISKQNNPRVGIKKSNAACSCKNKIISANTFRSDKMAYIPVSNLPHYCVGMLYGVTPNHHYGIPYHSILKQHNQHNRKPKNARVHITSEIDEKPQSTSMGKVTNLPRACTRQTQQFSNQQSNTPNQQATGLKKHTLDPNKLPLKANSYQQTSTPRTSHAPKIDLSCALHNQPIKAFTNNLDDVQDKTSRVALIDKAISYTLPIITCKQTANNYGKILKNNMPLKTVQAFDPNPQPIKTLLCKRNNKCATNFMRNIDRRGRLIERFSERALNSPQKRLISSERVSKFSQTHKSAFNTRSKATSMSKLIKGTKKENNIFPFKMPLRLSRDPNIKKNLSLLAKFSDSPCDYNKLDNLQSCKRRMDYAYKKDKIRSSLKHLLPLVKAIASTYKEKIKNACLMTANESQKINKRICSLSSCSHYMNKRMTCSSSAKISASQLIGNASKYVCKGIKICTPSSSEKIIKYPHENKTTTTSPSLEKVTKSDTKETNTSLALAKAIKRLIETKKTTTSTSFDKELSYQSRKKSTSSIKYNTTASYHPPHITEQTKSLASQTTRQTNASITDKDREMSMSIENKNTNKTRFTKLFEEESKYSLESIKINTPSSSEDMIKYPNETNSTTSYPSLEKVIKSQTKGTSTSMLLQKTIKRLIGIKKATTSTSFDTTSQFSYLSKNKSTSLVNSSDIHKNKLTEEESFEKRSQSSYQSNKDSTSLVTSSIQKLSNESRESSFIKCHTKVTEISPTKMPQCRCKTKKNQGTQSTKRSNKACTCVPINQLTGKPQVLKTASECGWITKETITCPSHKQVSNCKKSKIQTNTAKKKPTIDPKKSRRGCTSVTINRSKEKSPVLKTASKCGWKTKETITSQLCKKGAYCPCRGRKTQTDAIKKISVNDPHHSAVISKYLKKADAARKGSQYDYNTKEKAVSSEKATSYTRQSKSLKNLSDQKLLISQRREKKAFRNCSTSNLFTCSKNYKNQSTSISNQILWKLPHRKSSQIALIPIQRSPLQSTSSMYSTRSETFQNQSQRRLPESLSPQESSTSSQYGLQSPGHPSSPTLTKTLFRNLSPLESLSYKISLPSRKSHQKMYPRESCYKCRKIISKYNKNTGSIKGPKLASQSSIKCIIKSCQTSCSHLLTSHKIPYISKTKQGDKMNVGHTGKKKTLKFSEPAKYISGYQNKLTYTWKYVNTPSHHSKTYHLLPLLSNMQHGPIIADKLGSNKLQQVSQKCNQYSQRFLLEKKRGLQKHIFVPHINNSQQSKSTQLRNIMTNRTKSDKCSSNAKQQNGSILSRKCNQTSNHGFLVTSNVSNKRPHRRRSQLSLSRNNIFNNRSQQTFCQYQPGNKLNRVAHHQTESLECPNHCQTTPEALHSNKYSPYATSPYSNMPESSHYPYQNGRYVEVPKQKMSTHSVNGSLKSLQQQQSFQTEGEVVHSNQSRASLEIPLQKISSTYSFECPQSKQKDLCFRSFSIDNISKLSSEIECSCSDIKFLPQQTSQTAGIHPRQEDGSLVIPQQKIFSKHSFGYAISKQNDPSSEALFKESSSRNLSEETECESHESKSIRQQQSCQIARRTVHGPKQTGGYWEIPQQKISPKRSFGYPISKGDPCFGPISNVSPIKKQSSEEIKCECSVKKPPLTQDTCQTGVPRAHSSKDDGRYQITQANKLFAHSSKCPLSTQNDLNIGPLFNVSKATKRSSEEIECKCYPKPLLKQESYQMGDPGIHSNKGCGSYEISQQKKSYMHSFKCPLSNQKDLCFGAGFKSPTMTKISGKVKCKCYDKKLLLKQQSCQTASPIVQPKKGDRSREIIQEKKSFVMQTQSPRHIECKCYDKRLLVKQESCQTSDPIADSKQQDGSREIPHQKKPLIHSLRCPLSNLLSEFRTKKHFSGQTVCDCYVKKPLLKQQSCQTTSIRKTILPNINRLFSTKKKGSGLIECRHCENKTLRLAHTHAQTEKELSRTIKCGCSFENKSLGSSECVMVKTLSSDKSLRKRQDGERLDRLKNTSSKATCTCPIKEHSLELNECKCYDKSTQIPQSKKTVDKQKHMSFMGQCTCPLEQTECICYDKKHLQKESRVEKVDKQKYTLLKDNCKFPTKRYSSELIECTCPTKKQSSNIECKCNDRQIPQKPLSWEKVTKLRDASTKGKCPCFTEKRSSELIKCTCDDNKSPQKKLSRARVDKQKYASTNSKCPYYAKERSLKLTECTCDVKKSPQKQLSRARIDKQRDGSWNSKCPYHAKERSSELTECTCDVKKSPQKQLSRASVDKQKDASTNSKCPYHAKERSSELAECTCDVKKSPQKKLSQASVDKQKNASTNSKCSYHAKERSSELAECTCDVKKSLKKQLSWLILDKQKDISSRAKCPSLTKDRSSELTECTCYDKKSPQRLSRDKLEKILKGKCVCPTKKRSFAKIKCKCEENKNLRKKRSREEIERQKYNTNKHSSKQTQCECYDIKKLLKRLCKSIEKQSQTKLPCLTGSGASLGYSRKLLPPSQKAKIEILPSKDRCLREKKKACFDQAALDRYLEREQQKLILKQKQVKAAIKKAEEDKEARKHEAKRQPSCWTEIKDAIRESEKQAWPLEVTCNPLYIHTLKHKRHLWMFRLCPSIYPYFLNICKMLKCVCQICMFFMTACLCCPCIICFYYCCRGIICGLAR